MTRTLECFQVRYPPFACAELQSSPQVKHNRQQRFCPSAAQQTATTQRKLQQKIKWYLTSGREGVCFTLKLMCKYALEKAVTVGSPLLQGSLATPTKLRLGAEQNYVSEVGRNLYHAAVSRSWKMPLCRS